MMPSKMGLPREGRLLWFEDSVAYCDTCRELEPAIHLFEVPTMGHGVGGTWVKAVKCGDHAAVVAGRPAPVDPWGVLFL